MEMTDRPTVVVITPVFNEAENLPDYAAEVSRVLFSRTDIAFRVVLVDDGSTDDSWRLIEDLARDDSRFRGLRLSRNFGSHTALSAGFANAGDDAEAVATLACDLQDPPAVVLDLIECWQDGAQIVWGQRRTRDDSRWKVRASQLFTRALERHAMPRGSLFTTGSFFLLDRRVLDCFNEFKEHNRITFALVAWTGFDQARVQYDRQARTKGTSGWSFRSMVKAMYDAFIGLSTVPIRLMKVAAAGAAILALLLIGYLITVALALGTRAPGWASEMIVLSGFFAVQFWLMGIVGEYLHRIYIESMRRPLYFIARSTDENGRGRHRRSHPSRQFHHESGHANDEDFVVLR
jgi:dolichol-phosphate mannosyltransferase